MRELGFENTAMLVAVACACFAFIAHPTQLPRLRPPNQRGAVYVAGKLGDVRSSIFTLIGWLSVSACAAQVEPKCAELPVVRDPNAARAGRDAASEDSAGAAGRKAADRLITALLGGIPQLSPEAHSHRPRAGGHGKPPVQHEHHTR